LLDMLSMILNGPCGLNGCHDHFATYNVETASQRRRAVPLIFKLRLRDLPCRRRITSPRPSALHHRRTRSSWPITAAPCLVVAFRSAKGRAFALRKPTMVFRGAKSLPSPWGWVG
jgi:hypothetical protein